ncbi:plasmid replication, integration and excision activator [Parafrankia sp. BMG5.11]|uniref:plasmid replication, integration and excision activator n=1 Tax=Parafrankia sp. BMG5.11 TaxID=222540 RepID=UPI0010395473|nr:plasmid replication, integration and excision activator [Parafrankia sp. BMG5.11]TCJ40728.1 plasmid replication, integration and excision activator [Parafrankia sp. BMG5.11]
MAVPRRIPVRFEDVFPHGAYVLGVEAANDFDKVRAGAADPQQRDKETGARIWTVRVLDPDPAARQAEVKVKILGETAPVAPDAMPGMPFRPVLFDGLSVLPYVDTNSSKPRQAFSLRAVSMRPVGPARRTNPGVAA